MCSMHGRALRTTYFIWPSSSDSVSMSLTFEDLFARTVRSELANNGQLLTGCQGLAQNAHDVATSRTEPGCSLRFIEFKTAINKRALDCRFLISVYSLTSTVHDFDNAAKFFQRLDGYPVHDPVSPLEREIPDEEWNERADKD